MTTSGKPLRVHPAQIHLSALCRDPALAEIFRRAEGDDLAPVECDRPVRPRRDGAAAQRSLETV